MVGNDVVDLGDPAIAHHHTNERFVARVCSAGEARRVRSRDDLWTMFAAKEAAYKALVQLGRSPGFAHRAIVVAADLRSVTWRDCVLSLRVGRDADSVHAVARVGDVEPLARLRLAGETSDQGARTLLLELAADAVGCDPSRLGIVRDAIGDSWDGFGPPYVTCSGERVALDVSLSHDGRFVGVAARLRSP